jgi:hypothetical protein
MRLIENIMEVCRILNIGFFMKLVRFFGTVGFFLSSLIALGIEHKIKNENAIGFLDLSPQNWYLAGSGGYINSGDFDGGMISGRLGWDFFEKSIWTNALEFEIAGVFEKATGSVSGNYDGQSTYRIFKANLDQWLFMGNYRLKIALGKESPFFVYVGGGIAF